MNYTLDYTSDYSLRVLLASSVSFILVLSVLSFCFLFIQQVHGVHKGFYRGHYYIRVCGSRSYNSALFVFETYVYICKGICSSGNGINSEILELEVVSLSEDVPYGIKGCIYWANPNSCCNNFFAIDFCLDNGCGREEISGHYGYFFEFDQFLIGTCFSKYCGSNRIKVGVGYLFAFVCNLFDSGNNFIELLIIAYYSGRFQGLLDCMFACMFAEDNTPFMTYHFRSHYSRLESIGFLKHSLAVDSRFVGKSILADHRSVWRKPDSSIVFNHFRAFYKVFCPNIRFCPVNCLKAHDCLGKVGISCSLSYPIYRDLCLGCACLDGHEAVCYRKPEIIMAMHIDGNCYFGCDVLYLPVHRGRNHNPNGIWYVNDIAPCFLDRLENLH